VDGVAMKKKFIDFLTDRLNSKLEDIGEAVSHEEVAYLQDEAIYYLNELKAVIKEVMEGVQ
jgi:hypothetical protein